MGKGTVSILGCGWLGMPLAKHLLNKGFRVKGSVTSPEKLTLLQESGILPSQIIVSDSGILVVDETFFDTDVLIISIPPRRIIGIEQIYPAQVGYIIPYILKFGISKVIFISSTSVYPDNYRNVKEDDILFPDKESGKACMAAENLLLNLTDFKTTILRFGGLIGADRNPARFLLKSAKPVANVPVNLIHQDDCIGIISAIIDQGLWGETLNACCPEHPMKKDFYGKAAEISGLPEPQVSAFSEEYKIVDSSKLIRMLNYRFKYASPMDYLDNLATRNKE
jgi:nucleoside-diphosphate-sugar epimerase